MGGTRAALILAALFCVAAAPGVRRVAVEPPHAEPAREPPVVRNKACVPVDAIAGAIVTGERAIELRLKDGARWQMLFAQACPALGYYEGFYYRRAKAAYLCAGHDAVIARSGGECPIVGLERTKKGRRR